MVQTRMVPGSARTARSWLAGYHWPALPRAAAGAAARRTLRRRRPAGRPARPAAACRQQPCRCRRRQWACCRRRPASPARGAQAAQWATCTARTAATSRRQVAMLLGDRRLLIKKMWTACELQSCAHHASSIPRAAPQVDTAAMPEQSKTQYRTAPAHRCRCRCCAAGLKVSSNCAASRFAGAAGATDTMVGGKALLPNPAGGWGATGIEMLAKYDVGTVAATGRSGVAKLGPLLLVSSWES